MGHLIGFGHSGRYDSTNGDNPPTMATCVNRSDFLDSNVLSQDDAAGANWLHSTLSNRQLHSNIGMEQGSSYWGVTSQSTLESGNSGGATGPGQVRYKAASSAEYMYQTVQIATGDDNESYRSVFNYKLASGTVGQGRAALYRQTVNFNGSSNGCEYKDGLTNLNEPQAVGGFIAASDTGWRGAGTAWSFAAGSWQNPANQDGYKMQIRVFENVVDSSGAGQWLHVDNVRGEGT
jgi:hypothetical protein